MSNKSKIEESLCKKGVTVYFHSRNFQDTKYILHTQDTYYLIYSGDEIWCLVGHWNRLWLPEQLVAMEKINVPEQRLPGGYLW